MVGLHAVVRQIRTFLLEHGLALLLGTWLVLVVTSPVFEEAGKAGWHDWDSESAFRYITLLSVRKYHEFPFWHPYLCGGFAAWGYSEGVPNLVSPFMPVYFLMPFLLALKVELIGSALLNFFATYALVGRYTRVRPVQLFAAGIVTLNGRWAMQVAVGHCWYYGYAWLPVMLYLFELSLAACRERAPRARMFAHAAGAVLALLVYIGSIYPLPHGALLLGCVALMHAVNERSVRPIWAFGLSGFTAVGLSAPKLLAVADVMQKFSRKVESPEKIDAWTAIQILIGRNQTLGGGTVSAPHWGWHEWGFYIGLGSFLALVFGVLFERSARGVGLTVIGLLFWTLSLGTFDELSPWNLLHKLPVFSSQHVPSRFMAVALLVGMLVFASAFERRTGWLRARVPLLVPLLYPAVAFLLFDVADTAYKPFLSAFHLTMPQTSFRPEFKQIARPAYNYDPPGGAWAGPAYLAMLQNDGFVGCNHVPDAAEPKGAIAAGYPGYRGTVYVDGPGTATLLKWTPNSAVVAFDGLREESAVMYNMNHEPSWLANGKAVEDIRHAVGYRPHASSGQVEFRYRPRTWYPSLLLCLLTLMLSAWSIRKERAGA
jgi:hypothetical protein